MNEIEIQTLFNKVSEEKSEFEFTKKNLQSIIQSLESREEYCRQDHLLKIYILSTGKYFLKNGLAPWDMAEKSIHAAEIYMSDYPRDYEVNSIYLLLTNLTFKFEQSYQKAMELYRSDNESLKRLALDFLQAPDFYQEGLISKSEYEKYSTEYQNHIHSVLSKEV